MSDVRICIDLSKGIIDIEGDSDFVDKQLARFEDQIKIHLSTRFVSAKTPSNSSSSVNNKDASADTIDTANINESYEDIFEIHDDKLHIVKDMPGANNKEKMISAALLLGIANHINGKRPVLVDDIKAECTRHGCLDSSNFSKHIKSVNNLLIESGSGRDATFTLTKPGHNSANDLIERLRSGNIGDFFKSLKNNKSRSKPKSKSTAKKTNESVSGKQTPTSRGRPGPGAMLKTLESERFFSTPKTSDQIIKYCKETLAFTYETPELSSSLTRATRSGLLKRTQDEKGQYEYTSA